MNLIPISCIVYMLSTASVISSIYLFVCMACMCFAIIVYIIHFYLILFFLLLIVLLVCFSSNCIVLQLVKRNWACKCVRRSMFFWTHSFKEELSQYSRSWCNKQELEQLLLVLNWLILNGHQPEKITILSAYRGQVSLIHLICL